jgi:hypothetical protein
MSVQMFTSAQARVADVRADVAALARAGRSWLLGPCARWACPVAGGVLVVAGLVGLAITGGR